MTSSHKRMAFGVIALIALVVAAVFIFLESNDNVGLPPVSDADSETSQTESGNSPRDTQRSAKDPTVNEGEGSKEHVDTEHVHNDSTNEETPPAAANAPNAGRPSDDPGSESSSVPSTGDNTNKPDTPPGEETESTQMEIVITMRNHISGKVISGEAIDVRIHGHDQATSKSYFESRDLTTEEDGRASATFIVPNTFTSLTMMVSTENPLLRLIPKSGLHSGGIPSNGRSISEQIALQQRHTLTINVESSAHVLGKVVLEEEDDEHSLANLSLFLSPDAGGYYRPGTDYYPTRTDDDGNFEFNGIPEGKYILAFFFNPGLEQVTPDQIINVPAGETTTAENVVLRPYVSFTALLKNNRGELLGDLDVTAVMRIAQLNHQSQAKTDNNGKLVIDLASGARSIVLFAPGVLPLTLTQSQIDVARAQGNDLGLLIFNTGASVWGRIVDAEGNGVNNVGLYLDSTPFDNASNFPSAHTTQTPPDIAGDTSGLEPDGWFVLDSLSAGELYIFAHHAKLGGVEETLDITADQVIGPVTLKLSATGKVKGHIVFESGEMLGQSLGVAPVPVDEFGTLPFAVDTAPAKDGGQLSFIHGSLITHSNPEGDFTFDTLPSGVYRFFAQVRRKGVSYRAVSQVFDLTQPGIELEDLVLTLKAFRKVSLNISAPAGIPSLEITIAPPGGGLIASTTCQSFLTYEVDVPPATTTLVVVGEGCQPVFVDIPESADESTPLDVKLESRIPGVLVTSARAGRPAHNAGMRAWDIIVSYAETATPSPKELRNAIDSHLESTSSLSVTIVRKGQEIDLLVPPGNLGIAIQ